MYKFQVSSTWMFYTILPQNEPLKKPPWLVLTYTFFLIDNLATFRAQTSFTKQKQKLQITEKKEFFLYNKCKTAVKPTIHWNPAASKGLLGKF